MKPAINLLPEGFWNMSPAEKQQYLENVADEVTEGTYNKPLSDDEKVEVEHKLAETSIELSVQQKEYDEIKEHWRENIINPLKESRDEHVEKLKQGYEEVDGKTYDIRDFDNDRVVTVSPTGEIVETRRMTPSEKQQTVQGNVRNIDDGRSS